MQIDSTTENYAILKRQWANARWGILTRIAETVGTGTSYVRDVFYKNPGDLCLQVKIVIELIRLGAPGYADLTKAECASDADGVSVIASIPD